MVQLVKKETIGAFDFYAHIYLLFIYFYPSFLLTHFLIQSHVSSSFSLDTFS